MQFAVGFNLQGKPGHVVVDAEDALVAALKVKIDRADALITYVRRQNKEATLVIPCTEYARKNVEINCSDLRCARWSERG